MEFFIENLVLNPASPKRRRHPERSEGFTRGLSSATVLRRSAPQDDALLHSRSFPFRFSIPLLLFSRRQIELSSNSASRTSSRCPTARSGSGRRRSSGAAHAARARLPRRRSVGGRGGPAPRRRASARHDSVHRTVRVGRRDAQRAARLEASDLQHHRISELPESGHAAGRHLPRVHRAGARRVEDRLPAHHVAVAIRRRSPSTTGRAARGNRPGAILVAEGKA